MGSESGCGGREVLSRAGRCVLTASRNAALTGNGSLRERLDSLLPAPPEVTRGLML